MRRSLLGPAVALLLTGTLLSAPPAQAADPIPVTVTVAADHTDIDPDKPTATLTGEVTAQPPGEEPKPLPGWTVRFRGHPGDPATPDAVTDDTGKYTATYAPRHAATPVQVEVAPSGDYAGATATGPSFTITKAVTRLSIVPDRRNVDQGQPVTLGGAVEWQSPSSGQWKPLANAAVALRLPHGCSADMLHVNARTNATGQYSVPARPVCDTGVSGSATHADGLYQDASAQMAGRITVRPAVRLAFSASMDPYGLVKVSGSMAPRQAGVTKRYAGQEILIEYSYEGKDPWRRHRTVRLNQSNAFSASFTVNYSGHWRARYVGGPQGMPGVSPVRRLQRWGTRMSNITVSPKRVRKERLVTVSGRLTRYYNLQQPKPTAFAGQRVRIIFRFKGKKTWYHVGWGKTGKAGYFSPKVRAYGDGHFAAVFEGTRDTWAVGSPNLAYVDTYGSGLSAVLAPVATTAAPPSPVTASAPVHAALAP